MMVERFFLSFLLLLSSSVHSFTTNRHFSVRRLARTRPNPTPLHRRTPKNNPQHAMLPSSFWIGTTEFVDGSQITQNVIVSNLFWENLQSTLVTLVIGQGIATVVFLAALLVFATQFATWTEQLNTLVSSSSSSDTPQQQPKTLRIPPELRSDAASPDVTKLLLCIALDTIGTSSELLPFLGELGDIVWAPIAAFVFRRFLFRNNNVLAVLEWTEEILPFTDLLPLATICWVVDTYARESTIARLLGLGVYAIAVPTNVEDKKVSSASDS